ncbi:hypothetical protein VHEMI08350 [[Torrubiella] hemipterigena]|uniref:N-acetyltransferase domain-containing protein n=1 Tax=[Torrubiella] hemipterigena TaxID=1531966 RepID=A0A0A1T6J4_9HYPO|nr:hypothetical protein VHEMI08350 [[Torrubiella] hemipterigena]
MTITVRLATEADVAGITDVSMEAFDPSTDAIARHLFPPHLRNHANDFRAWSISRKSTRLRTPYTLMMVAVDDTISDTTEAVVGYSTWIQPAPPGEGPARPKTPPAGIDADALAQLKQAMMQDEEDTNSLNLPRKLWTLDSLGVRPEQQGKGIGKRLLKDGMDRAFADGCDCYLIATPAGMPLYRSAGFKDVRVVHIFGEEHMSMMKALPGAD